MGNALLGRMKHLSVVCLVILIVPIASAGLFAQTAFPEVNYARLLTILSDNGWRVALSDSNQVLLMPPDQENVQGIDPLEANASNWRIEQAQDGTIFLFFNNPPIIVKLQINS